MLLIRAIVCAAVGGRGRSVFQPTERKLLFVLGSLCFESFLSNPLSGLGSHPVA